MKKPGRPSHADEDREAIVAMAEVWRAGASGFSVRKLARMQAGLEKVHDRLGHPTFDRAEGPGTQESKAKRLERRFRELDKQGHMKPVSVYRVREAQRHSALNRVGGNTRGPFSAHRLENEHFREADQAAVTATAAACKLSVGEVESLSAAGLEFLKKWFPEEYQEWRI